MKRLLILLLVTSTLTACQAASSNGKSTDGYKVSVSFNGQVREFGLDDLKKLPVHSVTISGVAQDGPYLSELLTAAGIKQYDSVKVSSKTATITLTPNQIDQQTLLDFTNHGTVKLASTHIDKNKWVKDISQIEVN